MYISVLFTLQSNMFLKLLIVSNRTTLLIVICGNNIRIELDIFSQSIKEYLVWSFNKFKTPINPEAVRTSI